MEAPYFLSSAFSCAVLWCSGALKKEEKVKKTVSQKRSGKPKWIQKSLQHGPKFVPKWLGRPGGPDRFERCWDQFRVRSWVPTSFPNVMEFKLLMLKFVALDHYGITLGCFGGSQRRKQDSWKTINSNQQQ